MYWTTSPETPAFEWSEMKANWPHLTSIPFHKTAKRPQIDVLIGSDHPVFHHVLSEKHGQKDRYPIARMTHLGWEPSAGSQDRISPVHINAVTCRSHSQKTFCAGSGCWSRLKTNDTRALDQVTETLQYRDGRYEVGIPWKEG